MTNNTIEILDSVKHRSLRVDTTIVDTKHNQMNTAYITIGELSTLIHEYPIFITKNPNTGAFLFNALLGIKSGQNLFIKNNKWQARYLPLDIIRRPFQAMLTEEDDFSGGKIAIDINNELVNENTGQELFNEDGQATAYLERIQQTFSQLMGGAQQSNKMLEILYKHDLLEPVTLNLELTNNEKSQLSGLYAIKKESLAKLNGEDLDECHKSGALQVCHLIMSSGAHVEKLIRWANEING